MRNSVKNAEFRIPRNSVKMRNSVKIRNSVFRGIPYSAEFRKNGCVNLREGGVQGHWGSCHMVDRAAAADGQRGWDSVKIQNSAFFVQYKFRIFTKFRNFFPAEFREKIPQNSGWIPYQGNTLDTLLWTVDCGLWLWSTCVAVVYSQAAYISKQEQLQC